MISSKSCNDSFVVRRCISSYSMFLACLSCHVHLPTAAQIEEHPRWLRSCQRISEGGEIFGVNEMTCFYVCLWAIFIWGLSLPCGPFSSCLSLPSSGILVSMSADRTLFFKFLCMEGRRFRRDRLWYQRLFSTFSLDGSVFIGCWGTLDHRCTGSKIWSQTLKPGSTWAEWNDTFHHWIKI